MSHGIQTIPAGISIKSPEYVIERLFKQDPVVLSCITSLLPGQQINFN